MNEFFYMLAIIGMFFGAAFLLINLRHWVTGQEFRGTCASNNPLLKDELGECTMCGKKTGEACKMPETGAQS
jgi:hypothetical protein